MRETVSVVSPLYRSSEQTVELIQRVRNVMPAVSDAWELILIDDHCPDDSGPVAAAFVNPDEPVVVVRLDRNVGQLAAVNIGLATAIGDIVVIIDADLQDRPEDIAVLVSALRSGDMDVVAAGRAGTYTTSGRSRTARAFRRVRHWLSFGRIPADAGLFLAARRDTVERLVDLGDPLLHPVSGMARVGARIESVPLDRSARTGGASGYSWHRRLAVAAAALAVVTPLFPLVRRIDAWRWRAPGLVRLGSAAHSQQ